LREFVRFFVLDVETHKGTILPYMSPILPRGPTLFWNLSFNHQRRRK
jgi:hypothetical protein